MAATNTTREVPSTGENPVWVWDHDRRCIVWANESALRFWGERTLLDLLDRDFPPDDSAAIQFAQLLDAALRSNVERVRARIVLTPLTHPMRVDAVAARFALTDGRPGLRVEAELAPSGEVAETDRLREMFDRIPQALALFAEDGSLLTQNAAASYVFGERELGGLSQRYGTQRAARDALRALLVNGAFSHSAVLNTRFGAKRHRVSMRRMLDPVTGSYAALTLFSDTSERGEALLTAAATQRAAEGAILARIEAGAAVFDDALKPLYMNERARRLLGLGVDNADETLGKLFPRERQRIVKALTELRDGKARSRAVELAISTTERRLRWVRLDIRRGGWDGAGAWIATVTDVSTERRAAIAAQRAVIDRDEALAQLGVGILAVDTDGRILSISAAATSVLGRSGTELEGTGFAELLTPESAKRFEAVLSADATPDAVRVTLAAHAGEEARNLTLALAPGDRWSQNRRLLTVQEVSGDEGRSASVMGKSNALARVSHEMRTPLNAISGFTQMMLADPAPISEPRYVEYLRDIEQSSQYMLRLVEDLLDLRRIEQAGVTLERKPVAIANMVRMIVRQFDGAARKRNVEITLSLEDDLPPLVVDSHTIRQAVTNLLANAVRFAASRGWVRVSLLQRASGAIELEVIDNGEGMTDDETLRAQLPFEQGAGTETGSSGIGLGLPLARGFAEANGARFEIKSEKGLGTIARIVFPPKLRSAPD